jgi:hypothetical protein
MPPLRGRDYPPPPRGDVDLDDWLRGRSIRGARYGPIKDPEAVERIGWRFGVDPGEVRAALVAGCWELRVRAGLWIAPPLFISI